MGSTNALTVLLENARRVGEEWCWPATNAVEVVRSIEAMGLAVVGVELWDFGGDDLPTVKGWSQYELPTGRWEDVVRQVARSAVDELLGFSENRDLWVSVSWASEAELKGARSDD